MFLEATKPALRDLWGGLKVFKAAKMHPLSSERRPADGGSWKMRKKGAES